MKPISSPDGVTKKPLYKIFGIPNIGPLILIFLVATLLHSDGLFHNKSLMYGDSFIHGYPILSYHKSVLEGGASLLWSDLIFGGHPLHAEGQFSFFSPLNIAVALLFPPELGSNVFHWLSLILTGFGMVALCRRLGFSKVATTFAALGVAFSSYWLLYQQNQVMAGSLALIPWALWSFERWIANPSQYLALAIMMALMAFSGYPQMLHGTAIYMAVTLVIVFMTAESRRTALLNWKAYIGYGLVAVILCIGISAVQLIPTLELVTLSHRNSGIDMLFAWPSYFFRGLLFSEVVPATQEPLFPSVGSLLICTLASTIVLYRSSARSAAHLVAAFLLFNLGMGMSSPIFEKIYNSSAPLGFHYFRLSTTYCAMANVGICIVAASSIDHFKNIDFRKTGTKLRLLCLLVFWTTVLSIYRMLDASPLQYFLPAVALVSAVLFVMSSTRQYFGPMVLTLLVVEILVVKFQMLAFQDNELLRSPASVDFIRNQDNYQDFKFMDLSTSGLSTFNIPPAARIDEHVVRVANAISGSSNLLWGIPAYQGTFALPLARKMLIEDNINKEIHTKKTINVSEPGRTGLRLIDYLGIKYIAVNEFTGDVSMQPAYEDKLHRIKLEKNTAALPRFQTFTNYQWVDSPEEAVATIDTLDDKVLVLERPADMADFSAFPTPKPERKDVSNGLHFITKDAKSTYYEFAIKADKPGFLFIADANYPGWKAKIDGKSTQVFSAQVLGKAVMVPKGQHTLEVYFESDSFRLGLMISIATLLITIALGLLKWRETRHSIAPKDSNLKNHLSLLRSQA